ncbi:MAG: hypothetical protein ACREBB_02875 [Nitrosotalea sp.]
MRKLSIVNKIKAICTDSSIILISLMGRALVVIGFGILVMVQIAISIAVPPHPT